MQNRTLTRSTLAVAATVLGAATAEAKKKQPVADMAPPPSKGAPDKAAIDKSNDDFLALLKGL